MKTITIFLVLFINTAWGQIYPCVPDSLIMNWLNTQNSYQFRREVGIKVNYFGYGSQGGDAKPEYSYRSNCLSPTAKAKILSSSLYVFSRGSKSRAFLNLSFSPTLPKKRI